MSLQINYLVFQFFFSDVSSSYTYNYFNNIYTSVSVIERERGRENYFQIPHTSPYWQNQFIHKGLESEGQRCHTCLYTREIHCQTNNRPGCLLWWNSLLTVVDVLMQALYRQECSVACLWIEINRQIYITHIHKQHRSIIVMENTVLKFQLTNSW